MSIAICFNHKDSKPWATALQEKIPNVKIEIYPDIEDYAAITFALCWKADRDLLSRFPNLRVVQSVGASVDHVLNYQTLPKDVILSRIVVGQLSTDMFEYVLAGIMRHIKRFPEYTQYSKEKQWQPIPYKSIEDVSIAILGLGKIGTYVASRLSAMGFKVKGWSRSTKDIMKEERFHGASGLQRALH